MGFPDGLESKESASNAIDLYSIQSLGWEDPLEEGIETHSSILVWRIPMDRTAWSGCKESDTTEQLSTAHNTALYIVTNGNFFETCLFV